MSASETAPVCTTCPYCGVGCGVLASVAADGSVQVKGDPEHPSNFGRLCSKGSALGETVGLDDRLLYPMIGERRAGWDEALDLVARRFGETIAEHGPDSVAFYISGQILTEDYYVANKLMKGFIGSANIDTNSRLCMASSVAGHRRAFGSDTVPGTYADLEAADLVVLVGSNLAWCHPVLYQRIAAAKAERPHMKVVLVDPRRTMTADLADFHLAIEPDSDTALFNGLFAYLLEAGAVDADYVTRHTDGFGDMARIAQRSTLTRIAELTGLGEDELLAFYKLFTATEKTVTAYSQGVNQSSSGTDKVNAIINCHLITGRIGREGMGPFSLTGQPNAMGGREVGGLANMLACHMDIENAEHRAIVGGFWGTGRLPETPGLKAVDMFEAVADGRIKALWIMATNPVASMPDADSVEEALRHCPFVVVSDVQEETDTLRHAHVKLPAAAWGEKSGTVTNSDRRISRQRAFLPLPGEARPDWWQLAEVGRRFGFAGAFDYPDAAAVFREYAQLSALANDGVRDFDIGAYSGITSSEYDALEPFQWPQRAGENAKEMRFFAGGGFFTANGKARIVPVEAAGAGRTLAEYPLTLNTGRIRDQWHTMTRTERSARLSAHMAEPFCEIHPEDAARLKISDAQIVRVESLYAHVLVRALITARQREGNVFVPMHWTDQHASKARVDALVPPLTDAVSGQPASKNAAVRVTPFAACQYGFAVSANRPVPHDTAYWALARCNGGWRVELARELAVDDPEAFARKLFGIPEDIEVAFLAYADTERRQHRVAAFSEGRLLGTLYLAGEPVAVSRSWAASLLDEAYDDPQSRFRVIAGRAGADKPDPGPIVCACFGIGANQIAAATRTGCTSVDAIGQSIQAGTNCGSCRAEIREIIDANLVLAAE
ncbi:MAG: molybdopterin-dependent oxidoreductase [Rhodobiaceae bacterium]|nr:molybdopterin-dependent oxidoreductase [Rhodobiaceae bacterium]MCC0012963.1 molybdopterin-dependent oxidoreductase [Rhodobiaceae bacterium]MCC0061574.1 molybdopterin-dependent oxidoreductase [Rhodobiaceae bacterium]